MRIESVEIKNFRQYRNVVFDFSKRDLHDLHIVLGKNGIGKTNLLNAISWCLYGKEPHLGNEKTARKRINGAELDEAIKEGREKCKAKVIVTISVDSKQIVFERFQEFRANKEVFEYKPIFVVTVIASTGNKVVTDSEEISNILKQYLPQEISEYFFFDGEQLDKYFISNQGEKIHEAIYNISQVNLLHSMQERLGKVIKDFQGQAGKSNIGIKELNDKVNEADELVTTLKNSIINCKNQIAIADSEITICNEYLSGKEGVPEKEKEYQELAEQILEKEKQLEQCSSELKVFIREYKILFALYPRIKTTLEIINSKEKEGQLPPNVDTQFLERMLKYHKCFVCGRSMSSEDEEEVKQLLEKITISSTASHLLVKIKSSLEDAIEKIIQYPVHRKTIVDTQIKLENELKIVRERFNKVDAYLKNYQDKDKIREMHERRAKYMQTKKKNDDDRIKYNVQLEQAEKQLEIASKMLSAAMEKQDELAQIKKQIKFAQKSQKIVTEIECEMMGEMKDKMTDETLKMFKELDWKTETFSHIVLDEAYSLELYDNYGYPMVGACSAAERALLALSFTLALQKVSGYDSMLFIDTPVGRVDLENRTNFANVLSNISKNKQVIMTFTPSEYSKEIRDVLEPFASTYKVLKTHDESETYIG